MIRHGKRALRRVGGMTQANIAPALSYHFITEALEGPDGLLA
jgi:hypothetical protein